MQNKTLIRPLRCKTFCFTRDMQAASGNVVYAGIPFKPKIAIFIFGLNGVGHGAGSDDGTTRQSTYSSTLAPGIFDVTRSIRINDADDVNKNQNAYVLSFNNDGLTLAWERNGATAVNTAGIVATLLG